MKSRNRRSRARRAKTIKPITLPGGQVIEQKPKQGRRVDVDPSGSDSIGIAARLRQVGEVMTEAELAKEAAQMAKAMAIKDEDARAKAIKIVKRRGHDLRQRRVREPIYGCRVGRRLAKEVKTIDHRSDLWQAVQHIRRVWVAYDRAIGAPQRHAQCLKILLPADPMGGVSLSMDGRTQEERDRAAVSAWMVLQGWLDHVDRAARSATIAAVVDDAALRNWAGIVAALECVSEGIKGQRVNSRFTTKA
jgi:hypothetical protein